ncbi:MAG: hypothetical protein KGK03_07585 [Candidatus Omnitrophica bacterium]|nr:hypothetical protein [Candidatus Omnitrophota bacterium]MDE2222917.1 hypothetical protein [Candidatus Omnitrophota bacterium]
MIRIVLLLLLAVSAAANFALAQARDPSMGSQSSSTGVWPSVSSDDSISPGDDSSDHGNVS